MERVGGQSFAIEGHPTFEVMAIFGGIRSAMLTGSGPDSPASTSTDEIMNLTPRIYAENTYKDGGAKLC